MSACFPGDNSGSDRFTEPSRPSTWKVWFCEA